MRAMYSSSSSATHHIFFPPRFQVVAFEQDSYRLSSHPRHQPALHRLLRQQAHRPPRPALRRRTADQGLSGGERNRYALARMLMQPSNFLLLDEPTNHLDMRAKDVLLESLQEFTGTVVFVSHDRYFIDKLATRVFEVEDGRVHVFPGNYEDYLWRKSGGPASIVAALPTHEPVPANGAPSEARPSEK